MASPQPCGIQIQGNYQPLGQWECAGICDLWSQLPLQPKKSIMLCQQGWEPKTQAQGPLIKLESSGNPAGLIPELLLPRNQTSLVLGDLSVPTPGSYVLGCSQNLLLHHGSLWWACWKFSSLLTLWSLS